MYSWRGLPIIQTMERWYGLTDRIHLRLRIRLGRMNLKDYSLPQHLKDQEGLPRNHQERLLWIKRRVEEGFYDKAKILKAVAEAFLDPPEKRRAGDQAVPDQPGVSQEAEAPKKKPGR